MVSSDDTKQSFYVHYSLTYKHSIGIESPKDKYFDKKIDETVNLLKR